MYHINATIHHQRRGGAHAAMLAAHFGCMLRFTERIRMTTFITVRKRCAEGNLGVKLFRFGQSLEVMQNAIRAHPSSSHNRV